MLKIKILRKAINSCGLDLVGFEVQGHAGAGEYGCDIVCAGVSGIAQAVVLGLQDIWGEQIRVKKEKGLLSVRLDPAVAVDERTAALLRTFELGALSVAGSYPQNVVTRYETLTD
jgi:uncharacterized protein YsxB (DUF464 family)